MTKPEQSIEQLLQIMKKLRGPDGCPWDRKQTVESLKSDLVEETYEVLDAIESGDRSLLKEELGDLLLHIVFQSQICAEEKAFTFSDVVDGISAKLIRRHPHVFGDTQVVDAEEVSKNWDAIKKAEKNRDKSYSIIDGIPKHLPALHKAYQIQKRAARSGFDWDHIDDVFAKLHEEIDELKEAIHDGREEKIQDELGDVLFSAVNVSRFLKYNPEELLNNNLKKFIRRFKYVEEQVFHNGREMKDVPLEELDQYWDDAKLKE